MLKFHDGFDIYAPAGTAGSVVQKYLIANGYTIRNATDATFSIVNGRREGGTALRFAVTAGSTINASLSWGFTSAATKVVFGFAMYSSGARMRICRIENVVDIEWDSATGKVKIGDALGVSPLILNAWFYFEIVIDKTAKTIEVWANDQLQITAPWSGDAPEKWVVSWGQTTQQTVTATQDIDDLYVVDSSAGTLIDRLSPCEVVTRPPSADVTKEWSVVGADAATDHYTIASQTLGMETDKPYLQSNINGQTDMYRSNAVLPTDNKIFGVAVIALSRKGDLDDRAIGLKLSAGGQENETQLTLTENFKYYQASYEKTPGGDDWTRSVVETVSFGIVTR